MIDDGLRRILHTNLRGFHWQAIESGITGGGIPDSNYCVNGVEGWVECKRASSSKIDLSPDQVGWHLRRYRAGGRTFIAVRQRHSGGPRLGAAVDRLFLYPGRLVKELALTGLRNKPLGHWENGPRSWDWAGIRKLLQG
jgi:hypothetical protein